MNNTNSIKESKNTGANSGIYFLIYDYIVAPVVLLWLQTDDKSLMRKRPDCDYNIHFLNPPLVEILINSSNPPHNFVPQAPQIEEIFPLLVVLKDNLLTRPVVHYGI